MALRATFIVEVMAADADGMRLINKSRSIFLQRSVVHGVKQLLVDFREAAAAGVTRKRIVGVLLNTKRFRVKIKQGAFALGALKDGVEHGESFGWRQAAMITVPREL